MVVADLKDRSLAELEGIARELDTLVQRKKVEAASWHVKDGREHTYRFNKQTRGLEVLSMAGNWVRSAYEKRVRDLIEASGDANRKDYQNLADIMNLIADTRDY